MQMNLPKFYSRSKPLEKIRSTILDGGKATIKEINRPIHLDRLKKSAGV